MKNQNPKDDKDIFDRMANMRYGNFFEGKIEDGDWKEDTSAKIKFKIYMVVLAIIMFVGTVINYNYIGGIEAILAGQVTGSKEIVSYLIITGSVFAMPFAGVFFLWLAFKKKKK